MSTKNNDLTDLMIACINDNYEQVVYQVEKLKSDINKQQSNLHTALMYAIFKKNLKIATYLCESGADKDIVDEINNTALMHAIYNCSEIAIYLITHGANIFNKNKLNETAMHFASMLGDLFIVQLLFEHGLDINSSNTNKHSPIMLATGNKHNKLVKYFIDNDANINDVDSNQDNLLHLAIHNNAYDILLLLLMNKNNKVINSRNNDNESPLMFALKNNKNEYAKLLLKYGADPNTCDNEGNIPLNYVIQKNDFEMCKLLLKYKANPNVYFTWNGYSSPLFLAIKDENLEIKELLFDNGANDILFCYIVYDNFDYFQTCVNKNNINRLNSNGETLLYFAVSRNKIDFINYLLENGADPNICNKKEQNQSPLYQAVLNRNYEIFKKLIDYNADYNHKISTKESIRGKASRYCWSSQIYSDLETLNAIECNEWD
jgi:ankyrin repeat protein